MSATIHSLHTSPQPMAETGIDTFAPVDPRERYLDAVTRIHDEAIERRELEVCVDALAYGLAWVVFSLDRMDVTGDVLARLGRHIEALDAKRRAEQELQELRDDGGKPN
jgi:hypothetical protein